MKFSTINITLALLGVLQTVAMAKDAYVKGIDSWDFKNQKYSDLLIAQYQLEIWKGLHLDIARVNGQKCIDNYFALMDERNALYMNVTKTKVLNDQEDISDVQALYFLQANTSLKIAQIAGNELADTIETCTSVGTESWQQMLLYKGMYFDSGTPLMKMAEGFVLHLIGNAVAYKKVQIQLGEAWDESNWPLFWGSIIEFNWVTIWWTNLLYDPTAEPVESDTEGFSIPTLDELLAMIPTLDDLKAMLPEFVQGYLAPAPRFHKVRSSRSKLNHPKVKADADVVIEAVEYEVPDDYKYRSYTLAVGALEKYSTYFNYTTRLNTCDTLVRRAEQRYAKYDEDVYPSPDNWEGTIYDFVDGKAVNAAEALRLASDVTYNCQLAWKEDWYLGVWKDLKHMETKALIKMWLLHDLLMYEDVLAILKLTATGITWQEYHFYYVVFKVFYSIAIVALNIPNLDRDDYPYPNYDLDDVEERQLTDQMMDPTLITGIDFREIGGYVGNLLALFTMAQPVEEEIEVEEKTS